MCYRKDGDERQQRYLLNPGTQDFGEEIMKQGREFGKETIVLEVME